MNRSPLFLNKKTNVFLWLFHEEWKIFQCLLFKWKIPKDTKLEIYFSNHRGTLLPYLILCVFVSGILEFSIYSLYVKKHKFHGWWAIDGLTIVSMLHVVSLYKGIFFLRTSISQRYLNIRNGLFSNISLPLDSLSRSSVISGATNNGEQKLWKVDQPNVRVVASSQDGTMDKRVLEFRVDNPQAFCSSLNSVIPI